MDSGDSLIRRTIILYYAAALVLLILIGSLITLKLGESGNFNVHIGNLIDAVYFTVVTVSTVGYGDIVPVTQIGKIFVIFLIIFGLGIFASALTIISSDIMDRRLKSLTGKVSKVEAKTMRGHTLLIGYNSTNAILVKSLRELGVRYAIASSDKVAIDNLREEGYRAFFVDVTSESEMSSLNPSKAKEIIIDMRNDSITVYVSLLIKNMAKNVPVTVVAEKDVVERQLKSIGINNVINPAEIAADYISKKLKIKGGK